MGDFIGEIVGGILGFLAVLHLIFFLRFDTLDPCEVAVYRVVDDLDSELIYAAAVAGGEVEQVADIARNEIGLFSCYRVAVFGSETLVHILAKKAREESKTSGTY